VKLERLSVPTEVPTKFLLSCLLCTATSETFAILEVSFTKLVPPHVVTILGFETLTHRSAAKYAQS